MIRRWGRLPRPLGERILESTRVTATGCWEWTRVKTPEGYGSIYVGSRVDGTRRIEKAHRVVYELAVGPIPDGLWLDHLCGNRACCNPAHLEPVTARQNSHRSDSPAGINSRKTHCTRGHRYDEGNTRYDKRGKRYCRACLVLRWLPRGSERSAMSSPEITQLVREALALAAVPIADRDAAYHHQRRDFLRRKRAALKDWPQ
jgi:HNH endonuclease